MRSRGWAGPGPAPAFIEAAAWPFWEWVHWYPAYFSLGLPTFSDAVETGTHCGLAVHCCVASTSEVGREIPKLGAQADGDLQDLGQACMGLPAVEMPPGGQPPGKERKGIRKVFSLPFFSLSLLVDYGRTQQCPR